MSEPFDRLRASRVPWPFDSLRSLRALDSSKKRWPKATSESAERRTSRVAAGPGLEPGFERPKRPVFPLDDPAVPCHGLNPTTHAVVQTVTAPYPHFHNTMILSTYLPPPG